MPKTKDRDETLALGLNALDLAKLEGRRINPPTGVGHAQSLAGMLRVAHVVNPDILLEVFRASKDVETKRVKVMGYGSSPEPQEVDAILYEHVPQQ